MKKQKGLHFYINVMNFNDIVEAEELQGGVNHSIHALDTLFTLTEKYGKKNYSDRFVVEKITGARLHMFVVAEIKEAYETAIAVISYAYKTAEFMMSDIAKYNSLTQFKLQAGISYGTFYEYEFKNDDYEEMTTIGFACNYAAKLQNLACADSLVISENIYDSLRNEDRYTFVRKVHPSIVKYKQRAYYETKIDYLDVKVNLTREETEDIRRYAYQRNLTNMSFPEVKKSLRLESLSTSNGRTINGIPVFADVRDFTSQFKPDDSNLLEMAEKTKRILEKLYTITDKSQGTHVQFQGDREFALYHNVGEQKCFKDAVLGAMRMIDAVKPLTVHIGVGEAFGRMYAVKIGARGEKDRLIIGRTVNYADMLEDEKADKDQLAISKEVYMGLKHQSPELANMFKRIEENVYITDQGYNAFADRLKFAKLSRETERHGYNGAWGRTIDE